MKNDWERNKRELLEGLLGQKLLKQPPPHQLPLALPEPPEVVVKTLASGSKLGSLTSKMELYARVVYLLNEQSLKNSETGLSMAPLQYFTEVAQKVEDREVRKAEIIDCWNLLRCMIETASNEFPTSEGIAHFRDSYLRGSSMFKRALLKGSLHFLEQQYYKVMTECVNSNRRQAQLGGVPGLGNCLHNGVHGL